MKIFVINMKKSVSRREKMQKQLDKFGLQYEFFEGIDGRVMNAEEKDRFCDKDAVRKINMSDGQIGCAISHYLLYKKIIDDNIPKTLILEDDLVINKEFADALPKLEDHLKDNEIIMLALLGNERNPLSKKDVVEISEKTKLYYLSNAHFVHASAYMIPKTTAETLSKAVFPIHVPADFWSDFYERKGFQAAGCAYPFLTHQNFEKSSIGYVENKFIDKVTGFIDRHNVPILNNILKNKRKSIWLNAFNKINFTDEPTTFVK